jgi:putative hemolysin
MGTMRRSPQNRYIICDGGLDSVVGVVSMKDLWPDVLKAGSAGQLRGHAFAAAVRAASTRALTVLEQFRKTGIHVALVVDEADRTSGLVTMTDILEGLVGELAELAEDAGRPARGRLVAGQRVRGDGGRARPPRHPANGRNGETRP